MSDQVKPKRVLSDEQKAKMKAALEAKRADPVWQAEQIRKREERKAKKDVEPVEEPEPIEEIVEVVEPVKKKGHQDVQL
jgi:hypothetical protein